MGGLTRTNNLEGETSQEAIDQTLKNIGATKPLRNVKNYLLYFFNNNFLLIFCIIRDIIKIDSHERFNRINTNLWKI